MTTVIKTYLRNHEEYAKCLVNYWRDTAFIRYIISMPEKFPCIAIEVFESHRDYKDTVHIDEFVYLDDFPIDQPE